MKKTITILLTCVLALLVLGMVMLASSPKGWSSQLLWKQLLYAVVGLIACGLAAAVDYKRLKPFAPWIYGGALVLLALVLVPGIGALRGGARRWFVLGPISVQPSEIAKLALVLVIAWFAARWPANVPRFRKGVLVAAGLLAPALALIFLEPDYGATVLCFGVAVAMLLVAGMRWQWLALAGIAAVAFLSFSVLHNPNRLERVRAYLDEDAHKDGRGRQTYQAKIALGSGGVTGVGLGAGRQKWGSVAENHTDFIFSIVGEEAGLIATLAVVIAFMVLTLCGAHVALRAEDFFGRLLAAGVTFLIAMQAFINIAVVTGSAPNKGLSLPFISYGGSNLVVLLAGVGLLVSVARHAVEEKPSPFGRSNPFDGGELDLPGLERAR